MKTVITQNGETRECTLSLGQMVWNPSQSFWGTIRMFGEDNEQNPRILMDRAGNLVSKKYGIYTHEIKLKPEDFNKGKIIQQ